MHDIFSLRSNTRRKRGGFTLVELMVSVTIFSLIMVISMGAILSVLTANHKSQTLRSVMDNLNSTLESMTRTIRFGQDYHGGSSGDITLPSDSGSGGDTSITVLDSTNRRVTYALTNSQITRTVDGGSAFALTSPDVTISSFNVWVSGSTKSDAWQPRVVIVIKGTVAGKNLSGSTFILETTVSQRKFDQ